MDKIHRSATVSPTANVQFLRACMKSDGGDFLYRCTP